MHSQTLLLALAGTAAANLVPLPVDAVKHAIKARQTDVDSANACMSAVDRFVTEMPLAGAAIREWTADQTETDPCKITVPASLSSALSSYQSAASSFWAASSDAWSEALSGCGDVATMTGTFSVPTCGADGSSDGGNGSGSGNNDDAGDGNNGGEGSNNSDEPNAGHRATGFAGAAVALAGFLGVVALL